jgi:hypothetical protein
LLSPFDALFVLIWALPVDVGLPASWVGCHDSHVVGRRSWGEPKCSPLALLMVAVSVVALLILCQPGRHTMELRAKALPGYSAGVNNDGVFGCHEPPWLLGGFLLGLRFSMWKSFSGCRRSDDGGFDAVSFLEASLWKSCWPTSTVEDWLGERLKIWSLDGE